MRNRPTGNENLFITKPSAMPILRSSFAALLVLLAITTSAQKNAVDHFDKVIVSPYIQVTFVKGDEESVAINTIKADQSKLHKRLLA